MKWFLKQQEKFNRSDIATGSLRLSKSSPVALAGVYAGLKNRAVPQSC
jgi:hypothetical protein